MKKVFIFLFVLCAGKAQSQNAVLGTQYAQNPTGNISAVKSDGDAAATATTLAANGTYSTGWINVTGYKVIYFSMISDQAGSITTSFAGDTTFVLSSGTRSYTVVNTFFRNPYAVNTRYVKYDYTNGSTAQTKFWLRVYLSNTLIESSNFDLNQRLAITNLAQTNRSVIELPDTTNTFNLLTRTGTSLNVNVTNPMTTTFDSTKSRLQQNVVVQNFPVTQPVSAASLPLPTGASTAANQATEITNQTTGNTSLNNIDGDLGAAADAAATTGNGSVIALLKGINTLLTNGVAITTTPFTGYAFNYQTTSAVQTVKSSAGIIGGIEINNPGSTDLWIQFFNTTGTVTLGTTAPIWAGHIDATLGKIFWNNTAGLNFTTGIKYAITTTPNGNGVPGAALFVSLLYK